MRELHWLNNSLDFPPVDEALDEPNGLLAVGGDLSPDRLRQAYRHGIFPWFSAGQPPLWWSPDPRVVLFPQRIRVTRSLRKRTTNAGFTVTLDTAFGDVIRACAEPRQDQPGTWITHDMVDAYERLHQQNTAHSVEVWQAGELVGGLYGVALGRIFFGESMFSRRADASKVALLWLSRQLMAWGFPLIDCQVGNAHLTSLGAEPIARDRFLALLAEHTNAPEHRSWAFDPDLNPLHPEYSTPQPSAT